MVQDNENSNLVDRGPRFDITTPGTTFQSDNPHYSFENCVLKLS